MSLLGWVEYHVSPVIQPRLLSGYDIESHPFLTEGAMGPALTRVLFYFLSPCPTVMFSTLTLTQNEIFSQEVCTTCQKAQSAPSMMR